MLNQGYILSRPEARWLSVTVLDGSMERINLFAYFEMGSHLRHIRQIKEKERRVSLCVPLFFAEQNLIRMQNDPVISELPLTRDSGRQLLEIVQRLKEEDVPDFESRLSEEDANELHRAYEKFEQLLAEELSRASVYGVHKKGIYDTGLLVERSCEIVPKGLARYLADDCKKDLNQAGRCLAFELPTAAGFHIMRATESMLYAYWDQVTRKPRPKNRNWGSAIKGLEDAGADKKITSALTSLKDLHRNPLVHPEDILEMDEALALWSSATGVIIAISNALKPKADR